MPKKKAHGTNTSANLKQKDKTPNKTSTKNPTTMAELLSQVGGLSTFARGQKVTGKIISVSDDEVLIDIGAKSEGMIMGRELEWARDGGIEFKVGEELTATVGMAESEAGSVLLTLRFTPQKNRWAQLDKKKQAHEELEVKGLELQRAGLVVEALGIRGFIPASFIDVDTLGNMSSYLGKTFPAYVVEIDEAQNRLILAQKPREKPQELLKKLEGMEIGKSYPAKIRNVFPFGLLVDVSGIAGFIPTAELSWEKIEDLGKVFNQGDDVDVLVLGFDKEQSRLNLSVKQLQDDPWAKIAEKYAKNQEVRGKVTSLERFGTFVTLEPGIEALIHISKVPPGVELKVGQEIICIVESVDLSSRKISLSLMPTEKPVDYR